MVLKPRQEIWNGGEYITSALCFLYNLYKHSLVLLLQTAEISKIHAEEKEEEVTILEHSVEELESTITVLEEEVSCSFL
jgi:hypothetical protein